MYKMRMKKTYQTKWGAWGLFIIEKMNITLLIFKVSLEL